MRPVLRDAEWVVFGAPGVDSSKSGTFIVRGRWRRADVEACFAADDDKPHVAADGTKLYRVGDDGWLDFVDGQTLYVALNTKLDGEATHKLVKKPAGPGARMKQLLALLPAQRSIVFAGDGKANDDWSSLSLPKGSDVYGWMLVTKSGVNVDLAADPHDEKAAQTAVDAIKPQVDEVFGGGNSDAVGTMAVTRDKTIVRIQGNLTSFMLGLVTAALEP
jgi:hypothetical protein